METKSSAMHIASLEVENFKAHAQLRIEEAGTFVLASGANRTGKTSLLDSIIALVEGAGAECIRIGENRAKIIAQLGDNVEVVRTINGRGRGTLKITTDGKYTVRAPAQFLRDVLGACSFRPLDFFALDGPGRKKALLETIPMAISPDDWAAWGVDAVEAAEIAEDRHPLEAVRLVEKSIYDRRAMANREIKAAEQAVVVAAVGPPSAAWANLDKEIETAKTALREAEQQMDAVATKAAERARQEAEAQRLRDLAESNRTTIKSLEKRIATLAVETENAMAEVERIEAKLAKTAAEPMPDTAGLREKVAALEAEARERQKYRTAADQLAARESELKARRAEAATLDATLQTLREKAVPTLLARADMPIDGLSVGDDDILYNGVAASELSGSERLRIGLEIARAAAGDAGVICLDGLEQLDGETFAALVEMTRGDGYQYFATRVTDGDLTITNLHAKGE